MARTLSALGLVWALCAACTAEVSAPTTPDAAWPIEPQDAGPRVDAALALEVGPRGDDGSAPLEAGADEDATLADVGPSDAGSSDAAPSDVGVDDAGEPWSLPIDLHAPWSRTGTAIPARAALLAGCRVEVPWSGGDQASVVLAALRTAATRTATAGRCAVVLAAGTWTLSEPLALSSRVVLLGAGSTRTRLDFVLGPRAVPLVSARGGGVALEARGDALGGALGDVRFVVGATTAQAIEALLQRAGRVYAEISQDNDPAKFPARWAQDYAARGIGQLAQVVVVGPDWIELDRPLSEHYAPGTGLTKYVQLRTPREVVEGPGLMDLSVRRVDDAHESSVFFDLTVGAFVTRVESVDTGWAHVAIDRSLGCQVSGSWLHGAHGHGDGGRGYGVNLRSHTTACLVEDNALDDLRHALIVQLGANQNVYGYNSSTRSHDDLGVTKADISVHGHYAHLNLFEGNDVEFAHVSDWHGPTPRQVLFKNRARTLGMFVDDASERTAMIDNVVSSILGPRLALRAHSSVRRVICAGNVGPDGTPLAIGGRTDCDDENARTDPPRPPSLYRAAPLLDPISGEPLARGRAASGSPVVQP